MDGDVSLNGLNIEGKLLFPLNHKVTISTPYVIVQGELEIIVDHDKVSPENMSTQLILTRTSNIYFQSAKALNQSACPGGQCNLGVKPFVVVGGKVNINAMPETCAAYTSVLQKKYTDPTYNYEDFSQLVTLPETCPQSGLSFISYNFDDSDYSNWTRLDGNFIEVWNEGSVKVTNYQDYLFVARMKLDQEDGSMVGEDSTCKVSGQNCPVLRVIHYDMQDNKEYSYGKTKFYKHRSTAPVYGEYFDFTGVITFREDELYPNNAYTSLRIQGPGKLVMFLINDIYFSFLLF